MKSIMVRNIDEALYKQFKILCVKLGLSVKEASHNALQEWVNAQEKKQKGE